MQARARSSLSAQRTAGQPTRVTLQLVAATLAFSVATALLRSRRSIHNHTVRIHTKLLCFSPLSLVFAPPAVTRGRARPCTCRGRASRALVLSACFPAAGVRRRLCAQVLTRRLRILCCAGQSTPKLARAASIRARVLKGGGGKAAALHSVGDRGSARDGGSGCGRVLEWGHAVHRGSVRIPSVPHEQGHLHVLVCARQPLRPAFALMAAPASRTFSVPQQARFPPLLPVYLTDSPPTVARASYAARAHPTVAYTACSGTCRARC